MTVSAKGAKGVAPNPAPPTVCRVRVRFAKRGRLRFASHRDVARAFERAVRRAGLPVARSHGFSPHPRLSWVGAAPTGTASEAEYLEIGLTRVVDPASLVGELDAALPDGLDVVAAVEAPAGGAALAELMNASLWRVELPGVEPAALEHAVATLMAADTAVVQRSTKNGPRPVDARAAVVTATTGDAVAASLVESAQPGDDHRIGRTGGATGPACAILTVVVRQMTPAVRPDDVLAALLVVADLRPPVPPMATRLAQGLLDDQGRLADPFVAAG
jgi:radical SAM-linked protein